MFRPAVLSAFLLLGLSFSPAGLAQPLAHPAQPGDEEVIVHPRTETAMRGFVNQIAVIPRRGERQLGRWERPLCFSVSGVTEAERQAVVRRMTERAQAIGLRVEEPGQCHNNVLVLVSDDPGAVARELAARPSDMAINNADGRYSLGRNAFARFVGSNRPVRWWLVNERVNGDEAPRGVQNTKIEVQGQAQFTRGDRVAGGASRFHASTHRNFVAAFIIVDAAAVRRINYDWAALGDYATMVALTQLDPDAETAGYPTILNLFTENGAPHAMTEWDTAYLHGVYSMSRDSSSAMHQQGEIAHTMSSSLDQH